MVEASTRACWPVAPLTFLGECRPARPWIGPHYICLTQTANYVPPPFNLIGCQSTSWNVNDPILQQHWMLRLSITMLSCSSSSVMKLDRRTECLIKLFIWLHDNSNVSHVIITPLLFHIMLIFFIFITLVMVSRLLSWLYYRYLLYIYFECLSCSQCDFIFMFIVLFSLVTSRHTFLLDIVAS